jgi:two-component sensor histidine kinase
LLVNELLSNALKHGVSDDGSHSVTISLTRSDNVFHLAVSDRGRGLLDPGVLEHPRTLGLRLVHALSQQLYGRISYTFQDGAHLRVEFPSLEEGRDTDGFNKSDNHSHL